MAGQQNGLFVSAAELYPAVGAALELARSSQWDELVAALDRMSASERSATMRVVAGEEPRLPVPVSDLATPQGRVLTVLLAHCLVEQAWLARSSRQADQVTAGAWKTFRELLVRAERLLVETTARDRAQVDAWALRILTARGLQLGPAEARRRHAAVLSLVDEHQLADEQLLQMLCPKWFGDWPTVFEFARGRAATAAPGAFEHLLVVKAHLEGWVEKGPEYLKQQAVIDEVVAAAQASVWHPDCRRDLGWHSAHSNLALFFSMADMPDVAAGHFDALGDQPVEATWAYFDDPDGTYRLRREVARPTATKRGRR